MRATPNNSLALEVIPQRSGYSVRITDLDYQPGLDTPQTQTFALLVVKKPVRFWADKKVAETRLLLINGKSEITVDQLLGNTVPKGASYYIEYSLSRINSRMSDESSSGAKSTLPLVLAR
ncbi:MAG: hypothetical protein HY922_05450 [Elusimicrobia bacterium]|nr:hypothetical protein [Elusimicrobiota bacterium]